MFLAEDSIKDVIVAAIQATSHQNDVAGTIKETVDALIAADRLLHTYLVEQEQSTFGAR